MIGMNQIKKRLIYGILIGAGAGVIGIGITLWWALSTVKTYKDGTNKEYIAKFTQEVVMLNRDVIQGEKVTNNMLTTARVHKSTVPTNQASYEIVGQIAKYNIPSNIPLVSSMFATSIPDYTQRIYEISAVLMPADLVEGNFVDIRFRVPNGIEYIVMTQVMVQKISGATMWLYLTEEEVNILNSAIVDAYVTTGSSLYAVEYVDPETQIKLDDKTEDQAMLYLADVIQKDIDSGATALKLPDLTSVTNDGANITESNSLEVDKEKITTTKVDENKTTGTTMDKDSPEYINFTDNLAGLILKYALEYKYYVESYNKMKTTYQPSADIMSHMKSDPHIVQTAKEKLDADIRSIIETTLDPFIDDDEGSNINKMTAGWQQKVATQQSLRSAVLSGQ